MDAINNQAVAVENPVTHNETAVEATPVKAPKAAKKDVVIMARKSLMGKKGSVGAPQKPIVGLTVNRARGKFTKFDIFERNGRTVSLLTINNRLKQLIKAKELCKTAETMESDGPGRPAYLYSFDLSQAAPKKSRKSKKSAEATPAAVEAEAAPANVETPAPAPEATPATEQVAVTA